MRTLIVLFLACLGAAPLAAQAVPLRPDGTLSGARVAAGTDRFDVYADDRGGGAPDAEYVLDTRLAEVDGRPAVLRRESLRVGGREVQADSFVLDRATLAPLSEPGGPFLPRSMDLLLGALPLADGYAVALAMWGEEDEGAVTAHVRVTGREEVRTDRGPVHAWRVSVRETSSAGTYWMREDTRTLVQFVAADRSMRMTLRQGAAEERDAER